MFDKFELAKHGTPVPGREDIVKIDEHRYVITSNPYNVIINTSRALKSAEENKPYIDYLSKIILNSLVKQEIINRGGDPKDYGFI